MNRIATVFLVSVYGLTAASGLMLAFAEGNPFPEILTPPLAVLAYVLTDRVKKAHLPVVIANILGVIALVVAVWQMRGTSIEGRLLAGAHLVVYLTWIVLFQQKGLRQYWWMCALSVSQVAVGAILTVDSSYGGMLIAFMVAAIWTLAVFSLYQAQLQFTAGGPLDDDDARPAANRGGRVRGELRSAPNRARNLFSKPSGVRGSIQFDPDERWLGARFALSMLAISGAALVVAAAFFLFIPRLWAGRTEWGSSATRTFQAVAMSGFSSEVKLGDLIPLLENSKRVLQVNLVTRSGVPLDVAAYCARAGYPEPLFRGATMETYENGTWTGIGRDQPRGNFPTLAPPREPYVRQQILMEPIGTSLLFAIHPVYSVRFPNGQDSAEGHQGTTQLFRPESIPLDKTLSYEALSPPADAARSIVSMSQTRPGTSGGEMIRQCRELPSKGTARLVELARRVTGYDPAKAQSEPLDPEAARLRMVEALVAHLRDSGTYSYSLDTSLVDPNSDPVEDFLFNRKTGHCEYFASALALMLRAVDIPSRMVSGFKGGTVNAISGVYEVEQRHAHAWVEAFILRRDRDGVGYWRTFDATPAARDASVESFAPRMRAAHELASVVSSTWSRLVNLDITQQQSAFYTPILAAVRNWWTPAEGERPYLAQLVEGIIEFAMDPTQWFTLKGLAGATAVGVSITLIVLLVRTRGRLWKVIRRLWRPQTSTRQIRIAFYERFEALCAQIGLVRAAGQTQREFAGTVGPRIHQLTASSNGLADFPPRLAEFFYRARFAEEDLSPAIIEDLNRDLTTMEHVVRNGNRRYAAPA